MRLVLLATQRLSLTELQHGLDLAQLHLSIILQLSGAVQMHGISMH